jgi:hypothetical protein
LNPLQCLVLARMAHLVLATTVAGTTKASVDRTGEARICVPYRLPFILPITDRPNDVFVENNAPRAPNDIPDERSDDLPTQRSCRKANSGVVVCGRVARGGGRIKVPSEGSTTSFHTTHSLLQFTCLLCPLVATMNGFGAQLLSTASTVTTA